MQYQLVSYMYVFLYIEIVCDIPPSVPHARLREVSGYKLTDTAEYVCTEGYELRSSEGYVMCQQDGSWSSPPLCQTGAY